ncbi:MAG: DUF134 domain-containing protein [Phycisphaerales bacterium]|nr:MAG: DUF134 domain-containing protein [Phycisphaerales bacterium]
MPRPCKCRYVGFRPEACYFKPRGIPLSELEEVVLTMDEFESIRLADLEEMYQEQAAEQMNVSRQTFGNIINSAHKKIAEALVNARAVRIDGGVYRMSGMKRFKCHQCGHTWEIPYGTPRPADCPQCRDENIHRSEEDRGARRGGFGRGRRRCRSLRI